jgi:hypothetical protein
VRPYNLLTLRRGTPEENGKVSSNTRKKKGHCLHSQLTSSLKITDSLPTFLGCSTPFFTLGQHDLPIDFHQILQKGAGAAEDGPK